MVLRLRLWLGVLADGGDDAVAVAGAWAKRCGGCAKR